MRRFEAHNVGAASTVTDAKGGTLVCTRDTHASAVRVARALEALLVEDVSLHWFRPEIDELSPTERRILIQHMAKLLNHYEGGPDGPG